MDLKLKDVLNLERCRHIGTASQIIISEAVKRDFLKHQVFYRFEA